MSPMLARTTISNGQLGINEFVYAQSDPDPDQVNSNTTNSLDIRNFSLEKVSVGDIDIAYKILGSVSRSKWLSISD